MGRGEKKRTRALEVNQGLKIAKELGIGDVEARLAKNLGKNGGLQARRTVSCRVLKDLVDATTLRFHVRE